MKPPKSILIDKIHLDGDTQPRVRIDSDLVAEYAATITAGKRMPAITVYHDGRKFWLVDGFHRLLAAKKAGNAEIMAFVEVGDLHAARWAAAAANQTHGQRRTNEDKHRAIKMALSEMPQMSNRAIADHVGVSDKTVAEVRTPTRCGNPHLASCQQSRTGRDGKTYTMPEMPVNTDTDPRAPREKAKILDSIGIEIPESLHELWARRQEVQDVLTALSRIKGQITDRTEDKDQLWHGCNGTHAANYLERAYAEAAAAKPWAVCPMCQGAGCRVCGSRGLLSEYFYKHAVPLTIRQAQEATGKK